MWTLLSRPLKQSGAVLLYDFFFTEVIVPLCEQDLLRCLDSK